MNKVRLKDISSVHNGYGFPINLQGGIDQESIPFYKVSDMNLAGNEKYLIKSKNYVSSEVARKNGWKIIPKGSVILPKIGAALLTNKRRISSRNCLIDNNCVAIIPNKESQSEWIYNSLLNIDAADFCQSGAVPALNMGEFLRVTLLIPDDSLAIAESIDIKSKNVSSQLNSLKQKIHHLDEYKTALIHNAVTKGLDANGKRILDGTPVSTEKIRLKDCFKSVCGGIWGDELKEGSVDNISIARVANFNMDSFSIDWSKGVTIRNVPSVGSLRVLEYNDILLEKSGGGEKTPVGRAVNYNDSRPSTAANFMNILKPNEMHDGRFLMYALNNLYESAWLMSNIKQNTGIQNLDCPSYLLAEISLFSLREQIGISKYIDSKNNLILNAKQTINKKIALLVEYKKSLINEAVSGDVEVPEKVGELALK